MRNVLPIIVLLSISQAHAQVSVATSSRGAQEKLIDRVYWVQPPRQAYLDGAALAKKNPVARRLSLKNPTAHKPPACNTQTTCLGPATPTTFARRVHLASQTMRALYAAPSACKEYRDRTAVKAQSAVQAPFSNIPVTTKTFDVIVPGSPTTHSMFRSMVSKFLCPERGRRRWSQTVLRKWTEMKQEMICETGMEDAKVSMVLAMNGETPCAAALYLDAHMSKNDNSYLMTLIRNSGDSCKGGGGAILCHLIRNSKNKQGKFRPLELAPLYNEDNLRQYYESFGCIEKSSGLSSLLRPLGIPLGDIPMFAGHVPLTCQDPSPQKCRQYTDDVFDADGYFKDATTFSSNLHAHTSAAAV